MMTKVIAGLKGHHEPQEEKVFEHILRKLRPNSSMVELGSYWGYYSMWFQKEIEDANNYLIEPDSEKLRVGENHFKLNDMKGDFMQVYVGSTYSKRSEFKDWKGNTHTVPRVSLDWYLKFKGIESLDILHSDIQGAELDMLKGGENTFKKNKIGYVIISTHRGMHRRCLEFLKKFDFHIIAEHNIKESYSGDGLIAASAPFIHDKIEVNISKRKKYEIF